MSLRNENLELRYHEGIGRCLIAGFSKRNVQHFPLGFLMLKGTISSFLIHLDCKCWLHVYHLKVLYHLKALWQKGARI